MFKTLKGILIVFTILAADLNAQNSHVFQFYGNVRELHSMDTSLQRMTPKNKNTRVTLYKHGKPIQTGVINDNGKFTLKLLSNEIYKLEVSQDLYASQMMLVDTKVPEEYDTIISAYNFDVKLFPYYEDIKLYEVLDEPIKKLHFDTSTGSFKEDKVYFRQYKLAYENCENAVYNFCERINKIFLKQDEKGQEDYIAQRQTSYNEFIEERLERIYGEELKAYLAELAQVEKNSSEEKIEAIENVNEQDQTTEDNSATELDSAKLYKAKLNDANIAPVAIAKKEIHDSMYNYIDTNELKQSPYDESTETTEELPSYNYIPIVIEANQIVQEIEELKEIEDIEDLEEEIISEIELELEAEGKTISEEEIKEKIEEIKAAKINDIKLSIEFIEMTTSKKSNQIQLNKINNQNNAIKELGIINKLEKAKSKRKLLEIIAEAKTDIKKQRLKAQ